MSPRFPSQTEALAMCRVTGVEVLCPSQHLVRRNCHAFDDFVNF